MPYPVLCWEKTLSKDIDIPRYQYTGTRPDKGGQNGDDNKNILQ